MQILIIELRVLSAILAVTNISRHPLTDSVKLGVSGMPDETLQSCGVSDSGRQ
jgi:hypothetical protein